MSDKIEIHLVLYASQPDIQRACDKHWDTPAWNKKDKSPLPKGCYWANDNWVYTFEKNLSTCEKCINVANENV